MFDRTRIQIDNLNKEGLMTEGMNCITYIMYPFVKICIPIAIAIAVIIVTIDIVILSRIIIVIGIDTPIPWMKFERHMHSTFLNEQLPISIAIRMRRN